MSVSNVSDVIIDRAILMWGLEETFPTDVAALIAHYLGYVLEGVRVRSIVWPRWVSSVCLSQEGVYVGDTTGIHLWSNAGVESVQFSINNCQFPRFMSAACISRSSEEYGGTLFIIIPPPSDVFSLWETLSESDKAMCYLFDHGSTLSASFLSVSAPFASPCASPHFLSSHSHYKNLCAEWVMDSAIFYESEDFFFERRDSAICLYVFTATELILFVDGVRKTEKTKRPCETRGGRRWNFVGIVDGSLHVIENDFFTLTLLILDINTLDILNKIRIPLEIYSLEKVCATYYRDLLWVACCIDKTVYVYAIHADENECELVGTMTETNTIRRIASSPTCLLVETIADSGSEFVVYK